MFQNREEFLTIIDSVITPENMDRYSPENSKSYTHLELYQLQERARCATIQSLYSSTHEWIKASVLFEKGFIKELFICKRCNYRASMYNHISFLDIVEKVKNNLPTYDIHNEYIMYDCDDVIRWNEKEEVIMTEYDRHNESCEQCGLNEQLCTTWLAIDSADNLSAQEFARDSDTGLE